jgi:mannose-1-phosphate guanylyltransferase
MEHNYVIIMAGGIGSRFWPMSREEFPKQFHDVLGTGRSLIQQTADRFKNICSPDKMYVLTNKAYASLVKEQLPAIPEENILLEPVMRNTAPCIAYASYKIGLNDPKANMIVSPADHLILNIAAFEKDIKKAIERTSTSENLLTLGIKPHRPDTGYGYIHFEDTEDGKVKKVLKFTEKPPLERAKEFVKSGDYYWNSGIFIWNFTNIDRAFSSYLPEMSSLFKEGANKYNTENEQAFIDANFPACESISIDYGIMEKSQRVEMIPTDFGWSDLGTWGSLYEHVDQDDDENAIIGENIHLVDAKNNMIRSESGKTILVRGLEDFILVDTEKALLLCPKADEQEIKQMLVNIKSK